MNAEDRKLTESAASLTVEDFQYLQEQGTISAPDTRVRAIYAIGKERGYGDKKMKKLLPGYGVDESSALSISQASKLIDSLKNNGKE